MSQGSGSKSSLSWAVKTPAGYVGDPDKYPYDALGYWSLPFVSESLDEQINKVVSAEIRADRTVPSVRGGNIACGGQIVTNFSPIRYRAWLAVLLGGYSSIDDAWEVFEIFKTSGGVGISTEFGAKTPTNGTTYVRGDVLTFSNGKFMVLSVSATFTGTGTETPSTTAIVRVGGVQLQYIAAPYDQSVLVNGFWASILNDSNHNLVNPTTVPGLQNSLVIEKKISGAASPLFLLYDGVRINSLTLNFPQEGMVQATWEMLALSATSSAVTSIGTLDPTGTFSVTPGYYSEDPIVGGNVFILVNTATATAIRPLREANFTITNNIDPNIYATGSRERRSLVEGRREVNGRFTTYFEDMTEYNAFKNETVIDLTFSAIVQGRMIMFTFKEVKITGTGTPKVGGSGSVTADFEFSPFKQNQNSDIVIRTATQDYWGHENTD